MIGTINFAFIPERNRVFFVSCFSLLWTIYLGNFIIFTQVFILFLNKDVKVLLFDFWKHFNIISSKNLILKNKIITKKFLHFKIGIIQGSFRNEFGESTFSTANVTLVQKIIFAKIAITSLSNEIICTLMS